MTILKTMRCVLALLASPLAAQQPMAKGLEKINWPPAYEPSKSKFFVHNEIYVEAPPELVWQILIEAEAWPDFYKGAQKVVLLDSNASVLQANAVFRWKTMGLNFESVIREFIPNSRLSWESKRGNIQGYHAWLIIPKEHGCQVITDESQHGWLTFFEKIFQPKKLKKLHDTWLTEIKKKAELAAQKQ